MTDVFDAYSAYYDLLYQDKDYVAEVAYVDSLLNMYGKDVIELLEFGSGTGIHGKLLAEKNYKVTGVELSQQMVDKVEETKGFNCQQGDIRNVKLDRTYDAVLSLFHVMSYQVSNTDIKAAMLNAAEHLLSGGVFVFDFWYSPAVYAQKPEVRVKRMSNEQLNLMRIAEPKIFPNENRVDVHYTVNTQEMSSQQYQTFDEVHSMRHFSLPEIDLLAEATGFERVVAEEFLSGKPSSENTWGVCVILRKK
jgi:SAM-dependent methyltransferase